MNFKNLAGWLVSFMFYGAIGYLIAVNIRSGPLSEDGITAMVIVCLMLIGFGAGYFIGMP